LLFFVFDIARILIDRTGHNVNVLQLQRNDRAVACSRQCKRQERTVAASTSELAGMVATTCLTSSRVRLTMVIDHGTMRSPWTG
jgi:hypothetical protein